MAKLSRNEKEIKNNLKIFFDNYAKRQKSYLKNPLHRYQKMKRYLHAIQTGKISKNDVVLEIGCGVGYQIPTIASRCRFYYGIDFSSNAVKFASNFKTANAKTKVADVSHLPFRKRFFDVVLIIDTLENIYDREKVLSEASRVLKFGGRIVVSVPNVNSLYGLAKKYFLHDSKLLPPVDTWFNSEAITNLIENHGFRITELRGSFYLPPFFTGRHYVIPSSELFVKIYDFAENFLSKNLKTLGYHIIICARKD